ncbi:galanin receptor 2a-like [Ambystoma mexicanum]|uniref:galanin receptor 2a-like n=1 Tax=Ambystoma mexicanum TaxID=8296 RepID=UPI0037E99CFD
MRTMRMNGSLLTCVNSGNSVPASASLYGLSVASAQEIRYGVAVGLSITLLVGVIGNLLMGLVLADNLRTSRSPISMLTCTFMVNVTVSDLLFLIYNVPVMLLSFVFEDWAMGLSVCVSSQSMSMWTMFCSFYSMVATSVLRYVAVVHPMCNLTFSRRQRLGLVTLMWALSFLVSIPSWLHQEVAGVGHGTFCIFCMTELQTFLYFVLFGGVAFLPAVLIMAACYWEIIRFLWGWHASVRHTDHGRQHKNRKVTTTILAIVTAFIVMWAPYWVVTFLMTNRSLPQKPLVFVVSSLATLLAYSNCCISPIIYFALSEQFRLGLRKLFKRQPRRTLTSEIYHLNSALYAMISGKG